MDARYWMTDAGKYAEITAKQLVSGEPTTRIEQFPDRTIQVPLVSDIGGYRIGTANVTFLNGEVTAVLTLNGEAAKSLGIDLMFVQKSDVLSDSGPVLVAGKREG